MNKTAITAVLSLVLHATHAQKGITHLIKAEKDFAAYSVANGTKEAFLRVIDSNSVMFDKGKPVSAIAYWNSRTQQPGILDWRPQWSEISASGDFGYTTGPWTYRRTIDDTTLAAGQYATIWSIDRNGEWKFVVDFGIDNKEQHTSEERIIDVTRVAEDKITNTRGEPLVLADQHFNQLFFNDLSKAYDETLSETSMLLRNGFSPATDKMSQAKIIDATPSRLSFTTDGWGISPAQDLGYTFGTATVNGKAENYFRIWRREKAGWKIAIDLFRY